MWCGLIAWVVKVFNNVCYRYINEEDRTGQGSHLDTCVG